MPDPRSSPVLTHGDEAPEQLLREWFDWWRTTEQLPTKLPEALHVRTAVWLTMRDLREVRHG